MDRLADATELLDGPLDDPVALEDNLRDLRRLNRVLGGAALSRWGVGRLLDGSAAATLLDVGTGAADIPVALLAAARRRGIDLTVTAADSRPEILAAARAVRPELDRIPGLALELVPPDRLPWPDGRFDVAHASLVLHHLEPPAAIAFLGELARVARRGVVVNDLARGRGSWAGAWAIARLLGTSRYTRADAPLSVRRAYTEAEVRELLATASLRPVASRSAPFGHRFAIVAVSPVGAARAPETAA